MKKIIFLSIIVLAGLSSCEENMPDIPPLGPQSAGDRKVVIEEITGVSCVNCPKGAAELENLLSLYPDNLITISIHGGIFSNPYRESKYDFRTEDGNRLLNDFFGGTPFGYPSAVINRKQFPGQFSLYIGDNEWPGFISDEIDKPPRVSVSLERNYDPATRILTITTLVVPLEDLPEDVRLSLVLTQSGIRDYQLNPQPVGWKADYIHNHVLRDIITNFNGDSFGRPLLKGEAIEKTYNYTLAPEWDASDCDVVAIVHRSLSNDKSVLQGAEVHVTD